MASQAVIPRFLLPLQSPIWRRAAVRLPTSPALARHASTTPKTIVLEKPAKFNPPSHGNRLPRGAPAPKYYGPQLTEADIAAQNARNYPGLMAPEGTWAHYFWHSRVLHTWITMGTLAIMGVSTFFMNYAYNSKFKDFVPPVGDIFRQPIQFCKEWWNVILMHEAHKGEWIRERRLSQQDDLAKRRYFMKMHGIEVKDPVKMVTTGTWGRGGEEKRRQIEAEQRALKGLPETPVVEDVQEAPAKKWFGLF